MRCLVEKMIKATNVSKTYQLGKNNLVHALRGVTFEIKAGEVAALVGPSGSGKSTLLNILGGLDRRFEGEVHINDKNLMAFNPNEYRRHWVQTIFQQFYLVPALSVYENVTLPITFGKQFTGKALQERADYILNEVGLFERKNHKPNELSGGQIQRVAIARALITNPKIILADEPTGNLDSKTGGEIVNLLFKINQEAKTTIVIITHDMDIIEDVEHKMFLKDGFLTNELKKTERK
ncbi:MAG: ABC transporter ATP-binding protein [Candidatus Dojkabacteria bacterium]